MNIPCREKTEQQPGEDGRYGGEKMLPYGSRVVLADGVSGDGETACDDENALQVAAKFVRRPTAAGSINHQRRTTCVVESGQNAGYEAKAICPTLILDDGEFQVQQPIGGIARDDQAQQPQNELTVYVLKREQPNRNTDQCR